MAGRPGEVGSARRAGGHRAGAPHRPPALRGLGRSCRLQEVYPASAGWAPGDRPDGRGRVGAAGLRTSRGGGRFGPAHSGGSGGCIDFRRFTRLRQGAPGVTGRPGEVGQVLRGRGPRAGSDSAVGTPGCPGVLIDFRRFTRLRQGAPGVTGRLDEVGQETAPVDAGRGSDSAARPSGAPVFMSNLGGLSGWGRPGPAATCRPGEVGSGRRHGAGGPRAGDSIRPPSPVGSGGYINFRRFTRIGPAGPRVTGRPGEVGQVRQGRWTSGGAPLRPPSPVGSGGYIDFRRFTRIGPAGPRVTGWPGEVGQVRPGRGPRAGTPTRPPALRAPRCSCRPWVVYADRAGCASAPGRRCCGPARPLWRPAADSGLPARIAAAIRPGRGRDHRIENPGPAARGASFGFPAAGTAGSRLAVRPAAAFRPAAAAARRFEKRPVPPPRICVPPRCRPTGSKPSARPRVTLPSGSPLPGPPDRGSGSGLPPQSRRLRPRRSPDREPRLCRPASSLPTPSPSRPSDREPRRGPALGRGPARCGPATGSGIPARPTRRTPFVPVSGLPASPTPSKSMI